MPQGPQFTRTEPGRHIHTPSRVEIVRGESGRWFVYSPRPDSARKHIADTAATLAIAKVRATGEVARIAKARAIVDAAHAEAQAEDAARLAADAADALIHLWPVTDEPTPCGVDIMRTPYTYGTPDLAEVTCKPCLAARYVVRVDAKGRHGFAVVEDRATGDNAAVFTGPDAPALAEAEAARLRDPDAPIVITDPLDNGAEVDAIRKRWVQAGAWRSTVIALDAIMSETGVTEAGARELLYAESTASLASPR